MGKKILFLDLSNLKGEDWFKVYNEYEKEILSHPKEKILQITDMSHCPLTPETTHMSKEIEANIKEAGIEVKASYLGMTELKKVITQGVKSNIHFADNIEEAKNWLVGQ